MQAYERRGAPRLEWALQDLNLRPTDYEFTPGSRHLTLIKGKTRNLA